MLYKIKKIFINFGYKIYFIYIYSRMAVSSYTDGLNIFVLMFGLTLPFFLKQ